MSEQHGLTKRRVPCTERSFTAVRRAHSIQSTLLFHAQYVQLKHQYSIHLNPFIHRSLAYRANWIGQSQLLHSQSIYHLGNKEPSTQMPLGTLWLMLWCWLRARTTLGKNWHNDADISISATQRRITILYSHFFFPLAASVKNIFFIGLWSVQHKGKTCSKTNQTWNEWTAFRPVYYFFFPLRLQKRRLWLIQQPCQKKKTL